VKDDKEYFRALQELAVRDKRYDLEAYVFVQRSLGYLLDNLGRRRHVGGRELLEGIREFALKEYGPLARDVLAHWGVRSCEDFGEIVFGMVDTGLLSKTEQDSKDDFRGGYDFEDVFERPFRREPPSLGTS